MPATSAHDEEEQEGILTKKNVQAGQAEEKWRKQEGSVDQILAMSNSPKVQLSTFTTDN